MLLVRDVQAGGIHIEGVRILHDELPYPQQARLRPGFVAEFGLNLVPDLRQLLVAAQFLSGNVGHDFFMGHAQAQIGAFTILQPEHVVTHDRPAPTGLP